MSGNTTTWRARGSMDALLDWQVQEARRVLARQRYPVPDRGALVIDLADGEGLALLHQVLRDGDFPLDGLRQALAVLALRLRDRRLDLPDLSMESVTPEQLTGGDPATLAARALYGTLRRRARRAGLRRSVARREALLRATEFLVLCRRWLPVAEYQGAVGVAAQHAWAQCYAREFADAPHPCAPSAACDEAARLALGLADRFAAG